jgi:hypothetical protein
VPHRHSATPPLRHTPPTGGWHPMAPTDTNPTPGRLAGDRPGCLQPPSTPQPPADRPRRVSAPGPRPARKPTSHQMPPPHPYDGFHTFVIDSGLVLVYT